MKKIILLSIFIAEKNAGEYLINGLSGYFVNANLTLSAYYGLDTFTEDYTIEEGTNPLVLSSLSCRY